MIQNLDMEEIVEKLSQRYNMKYSKTYDLVLFVKIRLLIKYPATYIFKQSRQYNDAYKIVDKYLGIKQFRDYKLTGMEQ